MATQVPTALASYPPPSQQIRYGSYLANYQPQAYQQHYAAAAAAAHSLSYPFPVFITPPIQSPTPAKQFDTEPTVDRASASQAIRAFITGHVQAAGFSGAQVAAIDSLELEVASRLQKLYEDAHEYANMAGRDVPNVIDSLRVCNDWGLRPTDFKRTLRRASRKRRRVKSLALADPVERTPSPELLPSDDEHAASHIPLTLRYLPPCFPPLPPRHTYQRTPVALVPKKALPSLEKKLANAALVQESLKSLIIATEDTNGPEDADLVGHVVNWENAHSSRKRWRWK